LEKLFRASGIHVAEDPGFKFRGEMEIGLQALEWLLKRTDLQAEVQSASDIYVLQVVWRSMRDATLPHYLEKRESCCSLTEPNRSQEFLHISSLSYFALTSPLIPKLDFKPLKDFYSVGVEECLSVVFRNRSELPGLDN
jgi:hypothetical protein